MLPLTGGAWGGPGVLDQGRRLPGKTVKYYKTTVTIIINSSIYRGKNVKGLHDSKQ